MTCRSFPPGNLLSLSLAVFLASGLCALSQSEKEAAPETEPEASSVNNDAEVGYIRVLLNAPNQNAVALTVTSQGFEEPEVLYEGPGRLHIGSYLEIPPGKCSIAYSVNDRVVASSEITIRGNEFFTVNLLFPQTGSTLVVEKDSPSPTDEVTQRFRVYNFTGPEFQMALQMPNLPNAKLARNQVQTFSVPVGTHPIEVFVTKPATEEFGMIVTEGHFAKGRSLTMILFNDYRNKVSSQMFFDGVLE